MGACRNRRRTYVIQDPSGDYAHDFIRRIFVTFGLRPICLYSYPWERFHNERAHAILRSSMIESVYEGLDLAAFAAAVRERYDVLAVIPHIEPLVETAATLCELFDIDWNPPALVRVFRDKIALKRHLAAAGVRVPALRPINSSDDFVECELPDRFVLKPVDGYGNRMIGVFSKGEVDAARAHVRLHPTVSWILEEFIAGPEFSINGQVRCGGEVEVHGINEYRRCAVGGCHTVYDYEFQCPSTHPQFQLLLDFAAATMRAAGLRRTPFHLETIIDDTGPCVIDLGARLGGGGLADMLSRSHPEMPDVLTIAAHDYLAPNDFALGDVRWDHYDRLLSMTVFGLSREATVLHSLQGLEQVEAMPEFLRWVTKPEIGDEVAPSSHLYSAPYILDVWAPDSESERVALVERVRGTIRWNETKSAVAERIARLRRQGLLLSRRLAWAVHKASNARRGR